MTINVNTIKEILESALPIVLFGVFLYLMYQKKKKGPSQTSREYELTRSDIRALILGKRKVRVYYSRSGIEADSRDAEYRILEDRYHIGKLFGQASATPENKLELANGDSISPHSREHGLDAGRHAAALRKRIIAEYGIDLETMRDLENEDFTLKP